MTFLRLYWAWQPVWSGLSRWWSVQLCCGSVVSPTKGSSRAVDIQPPCSGLLWIAALDHSLRPHQPDEFYRRKHSIWTFARRVKTTISASPSGGFHIEAAAGGCVPGLEVSFLPRLQSTPAPGKATQLGQSNRRLIFLSCPTATSATTFCFSSACFPAFWAYCIQHFIRFRQY